MGLAYDIGGRGDASFNDSAAAGLDKAKADFGIAEVKELTAAPNEPEDAKQTRLRQLASEGYSPIIGVGFAYAESLKVVAPEFPNVKFAIVDGAVEGAANVTPLLFAEEQGSFLAGVIAAYKSKSCHVGFVGGVEIPLIQKFDAGFAQGAKTAAPDIKIEKKYLTPAGDFTGFQDPAKGQERHLVCRSGNPYGLPAKDRSGRLDMTGELDPRFYGGLATIDVADVGGDVTITDATPGACYAHVSDRKLWGNIFLQLFEPRFGDGVDVQFVGPATTANT